MLASFTGAKASSSSGHFITLMVYVVNLAYIASFYQEDSIWVSNRTVNFLSGA
jgi:hypothetical protein